MSTLHPHDKLYALERAVKLAQAAGEDRKVIEDLRVLLDEAKREARA